MKHLPWMSTALVLAAMAGTTDFLHAQRSMRVRASPEAGIRAGRDFSADRWTAGGHLRLPLGRSLDFRPSGDVALEDIGEDYQLNADLALRGPRDQAFIGAGAGYVHRGSGHDGDVGLNLFLGFRPIPRPGSQIYLEGRWTFVEGETIFRIGAGVAFRL